MLLYYLINSVRFIINNSLRYCLHTYWTASLVPAAACRVRKVVESWLYTFHMIRWYTHITSSHHCAYWRYWLFSRDCCRRFHNCNFMALNFLRLLVPMQSQSIMCLDWHPTYFIDFFLQFVNTLNLQHTQIWYFLNTVHRCVHSILISLFGLAYVWVLVSVWIINFNHS